MDAITLHTLINPIGIVIVLTVLLGVIVIRGFFLGYPKRTLPKGSALSRKEQAIVAAVADAMFPGGGPIPLSGTEAGLVLYMDTYIRRVSPRLRLLLHLLITFLEHGPWLFGPHHARFTGQHPNEQVKTLDDMMRGSIYIRRIAFFSIRTILSMGYLANATVIAFIGCSTHRAPFEPDLTFPAIPRVPTEVPA